MKIVIDIPDEIYNHTQKYEVGGFNIENDTKLFLAIKNGTPLPKGHGRLIDADALIEQLEATANIEWNMQVGSSKGLEDAIDIVDDSPTIIKADNVESEE